MKHNARVDTALRRATIIIANFPHNNGALSKILVVVAFFWGKGFAALRSKLGIGSSSYGEVFYI